MPLGQIVDNRYQILAPCIWLDTQPEQPPQTPDTLPAFALPYLKAYPQSLHVPTLYGICYTADGEPILLLSNIPVDRAGKLLPSLRRAWEQTTGFRQVYWCWQMLQLWQSLSALGVAASLLKEVNVRVDSWRLRLVAFTSQPAAPTLADLAAHWRALLPKADPQVAAGLEPICQQLQAANVDLANVEEQLNRLLLSQAMTLSISLAVAGNTSAGPQQPRNEDACYPSYTEYKRTQTADLPALPRLAIVCDGVGGHAGGEVASQTVVRTLQLQFRSLLAEAEEETTPLPPALVMEQIEAAIRVANNLVANQNDSQGRAERQRMGTTLVAALQLRQRIPTDQGWEDINELYIAHAGDSRAYWITPEGCCQLTLDDDIAGREVAAGRSVLAAARQRPDAGSLTQAIGIREAEFLKPHIQRFILDEEGVLLLCSDGLSDHHRVEESWANYIGLIVKRIVSLQAAVDSWIELANQKNGHDNVAVVLMHCQVTPGAPTVQDTGSLTRQQDNLETELTEASKALLYGETEEDAPAVFETPAPPQPATFPWKRTILTLMGLGILGIGGFLVWQFIKASPSPEPAPQTLPNVPE
jgi:protein phosphatase